MTSDSLWHESWLYSRTLKFQATNSPPLEVSRDFTQHPYPPGSYGQDGTVAGTTAWTCYKNLLLGDFPGAPVAGTLCFHCRGHGFNPW